MISVTVNGKPRRLKGPLNITAFLRAVNISARQVAVALNGEVVPRGDWTRATINDGDAVEVVRAVGGGAQAITRREAQAKDPIDAVKVLGAALIIGGGVLVRGF